MAALMTEGSVLTPAREKARTKGLDAAVPVELRRSGSSAETSRPTMLAE